MFTVYRDSLPNSERLWGHPVKTIKEITLKGARSTQELLRWTVILQNRSLPLLCLFVVSYLAK